MGCFRSDPSIDYYAVFDGHGGSEVSAYCSEELHRHIDPRSANIPNMFEEAYRKTHRGCVSRKGGACALTVLITATHIHVANVGDSRCILLSRDGVIRLSTDHKPNEASEKARLEGLGVAVDYDRNGKCYRVQPAGLSVSRSLGDRSANGVIQTPAVFSHTLDESCYALILASDGLWDVVRDNEIPVLIKSGLNRSAHASDLAQFLLKEARDNRQSGDNCSVIAVFLQDIAKW